MKKPFIFFCLIALVLCLASCEQKQEPSHKVVTVKLAKEAGSRHDYVLEYYSDVYKGFVRTHGEPDTIGYNYDYFDLPMNRRIHVYIDDIDKGYITITQPYQAFNL